MRYLTALILCALTATAGATTLDEGMKRLAETVAPQLLDERLRPGVEGPVDLFLLDPADATSGEPCDALSDTLLFRMAAAMQAALREYRRDVATVILRQRAAEGELAMQLDWVARKPGFLELRPSYGRIRGDNIAGTFILPVEIATSDLSPQERACFADPAEDAARRVEPEAEAGDEGRARLDEVDRRRAIDLASSLRYRPPESLGDLIERLVRDDLPEVVAHPIVVDAVMAQNRRTAELSRAEIARLDKTWRSLVHREVGSEEALGRLVTSVTDNQASRFLALVRDYSGDVVEAVMIMDAVGLNVAVSEVTVDYWQGDEMKWTRPFEEGRFDVGDFEFDETGNGRTQLAIPIQEPRTGKTIGAAAFTIRLNSLLP